MDDNKSSKAVAGTGVAGAGAYTIKKQYDKGNLTGRETMYHNTRKSNINSILDKGLDASKATDPNNLTKTILTDKTDKELANKVYMARKKKVADTVGKSRAQQDLLKNKPELFKSNLYDSPFEIARKNYEIVKRRDVDAKLHHKTLKAKVPSWKLKEVDNPEIAGQTMDEFFGAAKKRVNDQAARSGVHISEEQLNQYRKLANKNYKNVGRKSTATFEGSIGPEVFKKSKHYKKVSSKEILEFIRKNPKRFAKGAGIAGVGALGIGLGAKLIRDSLKKNNVKKRGE